MKKLIFVLFIFALVTPVFAQSNSAQSQDMYYINVPVERIYITTQGYVIQYRSGSSILGTIGIPIEWFGNANFQHGSTSYGSGGSNKADVVRLPAASDWPTMSVFYVDGVFSHVRLYVHSLKSHPTWGSLPQGSDVSRFFGDKENFDIKY
ncbi:MAG: hypothetical protein FWC17_01195 [Treponema sp.]|nr:hypothetical protein [Treponema sp.]MCL2266364.1 hypothetical protein [Treponema sp.]